MAEKRFLVTNVKHFLGTPIVKVLARSAKGCTIFAHDSSFEDSKQKNDFLRSLNITGTEIIQPIGGKNVSEITENVDNQVDVLINNDAYEAKR